MAHTHTCAGWPQTFALRVQVDGGEVYSLLNPDEHAHDEYEACHIEPPADAQSQAAQPSRRIEDV